MLTDNGYWDYSVPFNFQSECDDVIEICDTVVYDLSIILNAIDNDKITDREIALLEELYIVAKKKEKGLVEAFKRSDIRWSDDENYKKMESLYKIGRDFYVMLFNLDNIAGRMEHYKKNETIVDNSVHAENSVVIGNSKLNNCKLNIEKGGKQTGFVKDVIIPFFIAVGSGIVIYMITKMLF